MSTQMAYKQYKEVQVNTASKEKLLIMLYQGAIKFLRIARKHIQDSNFEGANQNLIKAQNIINELSATLDRDNGGEVADNLFSLYQYMNHQLIQANIKKDTKLIEIVEDMLMELLESWQEIIKSN